MNAPAWFDELETLCNRFRETGLMFDIGAMNATERWHTLQYLRRKLSEETSAESEGGCATQ